MRFFFWFVVSSLLLTLARPGVAQDSLTFNTTPLTLTPSTVVDASTALRWRLSGALGYHWQLQNTSLYESLYLKNGAQATIAADYFIGRTWGLGLLIGYQNLVVSDQYKRDPGIPKSNDNSFPTFAPITNFHSFMIAAGPAFSIPVSPRLTVDLDGRIGGFYNDSPLINAYDSRSRNPLLTVAPSNERIHIGFTGSFGLKYQCTPQFGLGIASTINYTSFSYRKITYTNPTQNLVDLGMIGVQATVSYRFLSTPRQRPTVPGTAAVVAVVPPKPACYPPVLDPAQQTEYEAGSPRRPVIRWRSSAPIYTEGEQYTFRLYTLPGNKLLYQQTVREHQLSWPAQLAIPDTSSYFFYSLYTSRSDDSEQTCQSEPVVGTLGFLGNQSPVSTPSTTPRAPASPFTLRLYALQPSLILQKAPVQAELKRTKRPAKSPRLPKGRPTKPIKQPTVVALDSVSARTARLSSVRPDSARTHSTTMDSLDTRSAAPDSVRNRSLATDSSRSDSTLLISMRIIPSLLYEEPTQQLNFNWSGKVALPSLPTVYQYTITRNSNGVLVQSYYLMVEPDGCFSIIPENTKNKFLRSSIPPDVKPMLESVQPTNKGQP